jgi:hypothetical protein
VLNPGAKYWIRINTTKPTIMAEIKPIQTTLL